MAGLVFSHFTAPSVGELYLPDLESPGSSHPSDPGATLERVSRTVYRTTTFHRMDVPPIWAARHLGSLPRGGANYTVGILESRD